MFYINSTSAKGKTMDFKEEYKTFSNKIKAASNDKAKLDKLDKSLDRLYEAGVFTVKQFERLSMMIFDRLVKRGL